MYEHLLEEERKGKEQAWRNIKGEMEGDDVTRRYGESDWGNEKKLGEKIQGEAW